MWFTEWIVMWIVTRIIRNINRIIFRLNIKNIRIRVKNGIEWGLSLIDLINKLWGCGRWNLINIRKLNGNDGWFVEWKGKTWLIEGNAIINVVGGGNFLKWFGIECRGIEGIDIVE